MDTHREKFRAQWGEQHVLSPEVSTSSLKSLLPILMAQLYFHKHKNKRRQKNQLPAMNLCPYINGNKHNDILFFNILSFSHNCVSQPRKVTGLVDVSSAFSMPASSPLLIWLFKLFTDSPIPRASIIKTHLRSAPGVQGSDFLAHS